MRGCRHPRRPSPPAAEAAPAGTLPAAAYNPLPPAGPPWVPRASDAARPAAKLPHLASPGPWRRSEDVALVEFRPLAALGRRPTRPGSWPPSVDVAAVLIPLRR